MSVLNRDDGGRHPLGEFIDKYVPGVFALLFYVLLFTGSIVATVILPPRVRAKWITW